MADDYSLFTSDGWDPTASLFDSNSSWLNEYIPSTTTTNYSILNNLDANYTDLISGNVTPDEFNAATNYWSGTSGVDYATDALAINANSSSGASGLSSFLSKLVSGASSGSGIAGLAGALYGYLNSKNSSGGGGQTGYLGGIPKYQAVRQEVPGAAAAGAPGMGHRYFTNTYYIPEGNADAQATAQTNLTSEANKLQQLNTYNQLLNTDAGQARNYLSYLQSYQAPQTQTQPTTPALSATPTIPDVNTQNLAHGGIARLPNYLNGNTDGMADKLPANIDGKQEARLSHGEFVIPADVVGHLGNGNSNAGAQRLYDMMSRIRQARTGSPDQGKQINPNRYLPR